MKKVRKNQLNILKGLLALEVMVENNDTLPYDLTEDDIWGVLCDTVKDVTAVDIAEAARFIKNSRKAALKEDLYLSSLGWEG
jgi:hypothetical protein